MYEVSKGDAMMNCESAIELWSDNSMQTQLEGYRKNRDAIFCLVRALNSHSVNGCICSTIHCAILNPIQCSVSAVYISSLFV